AARRCTAIASGGCAVALAVMISACGALGAAGRSGPARATGAAGLTRTSARAESAGPREVVTNVIDQLSPRIAVVGIGAGPSVLNGRARLVLTTNFGRTFTSIGPRTAKLTEPDSVFFLDRDHGWFATFSVLNLAEKVYR